MSWVNFTKRASEVRTFTVDFRRKLLANELLSGTPTVAEVTTTALTIGSPSLTVSPTVPIGKIFTPTDQGVQFSVSGGVAGNTYAIRVTVSTGASPIQTFIQDVTLRVI